MQGAAPAPATAARATLQHLQQQESRTNDELQHRGDNDSSHRPAPQESSGNGPDLVEPAPKKESGQILCYYFGLLFRLQVLLLLILLSSFVL